MTRELRWNVQAGQRPELSICVIDRVTGRSASPPRAAWEEVLNLLNCRHEIISVSFAGRRDSSCSATLAGSYRAALQQAFDQSSGEYVVTADSFLATDPYFLLNFWAVRDRADLAIASRFAPGGIYHTGFARRTAASWLNWFSRGVLSLPYYDLTSAFRMYRRAALAEALKHSRSTGYDFLAESTVHLHGLGRAIEEIPFVSRTAHVGRSNVPAGEVALPLLVVLPRLWRVRNSVFSADYDERAFNSLIWPQRYWQRKRFQIITRFVESPAAILDIGCGSSKIIQAFPGAVGLDIQLKKLRYLFKRRSRLVQGSAFRLPFADASFNTVICSEVIEHIPFDEILFDEFRRVLRPGGVLVLGTPDYGTWVWPAIEWLYSKLVPGGYAHEHITHYTARQLAELVRSRDFQIEDTRTICGAELILKARAR